MIPSKVKIGGLTYKCSLEKNLARDRNSLGESCGNELSITIDESTSQQTQNKTLIHEIIEQLNFNYDIDLEHHKICLIETGLYQVIVDNPGIFNFKEESNETKNITT